ncbi:ATPase family AAA domain-containing protein 5b isoform X1 [Thunnus maccoyii]|uniref:ATPase family AAA domain-containing protein 5b isoform X1 n=1 Tax=Thunnus maccoyii TaxID=8240 RepID=UPI001C4ACF3A|nr:ATPase family AAA domain-containing protein 5b isoform X1 [Thunnus maccoyii]
MLNKLKRTKTSKNASFTSKNPPRATEVITLVLSEDETSPERDAVLLAAIDSKASNAAAGSISSCKAQPLQEKRRTCCAKDVKIAPIFLRTTQQGKRKRSSDGGLDRPVDELQKSVHPPKSDDSQLVKSQLSTPAGSHLTERKGSRRGQLSSSAVLSCLEEIQTSNPAFPVQRVFDTLQEKDLGSSAVKSSYSRQSWFKGKRKCGNESSQVSKRLKSSLTTEGTTGTSHRPLPAHGVQGSADVSVKQQPRSGRLSRTHRLKQQRENVGLVNNCETNSGSDRQSLITCDILQRDSSFEDVLWTDKYSPQCSSEVIGNSASVKKLHSWLKKWKLRADCDERRKKEERKQEENSSDSWDCGDFQGEAVTEGDRVEPLCNTMLITGPSGVGKTASVHACAQELGFKVFEVNCSSQRSGRHILSQLKEATQSHLVETSGRDPLKPAYFNNYNTKSCSTNSENIPGKSAAPKNVISSSKKRPAQKFGRKRKANPAAVTLANYFKMKAKADHLHFGGLSPPPEKPDIKKLNNSSPGWDQTAPQNKQTTTSLILFEEVDVVFEDDVGFLAAIKTFMTTTKRPVVLTTNDPSFRERFSCSLEEIIFKTPSAMNVSSYLQLVCLAENARLELDDVLGLLTLTRGDVRRCLLQLQLWVNGGGGRASQNSNVEGGVSLDSQLPPRDAGCTSSMLGLHPATQNHLLNLLQSWTDPDMNELLQLLAESWRRNVPLLYCNQELLLPIRAEGTPVHYLDKVTSSGQQSQLDGNINPKATAANSDSVRNISRLSRRKYTSAAFDATSSSNLTQKPQRASLTFKATHLRAQSSDDKTEPNADKVATDCLDALTDFFDLMSYLNATKPAAEPLISGSCRPEFVWTGAEMKDSLLDEMREEEEEEEEGRSCCQERWLDIQAAVEGLGFRRCWRRVSESWTEAQKCRQELGGTRWGKLVETLTLPVSADRESLGYSFQPLCAPSVFQRRYEMNRMVLGSRSFSLLGNRQAVSVDYMPVLRSICRSQRPPRGDEPVSRCVNYLSSMQLGLSKSTLQLLAEDF